MSSPPPPSSNPLKRPSISSASSQPLGSHPKRPRMHPLRQTSFPNTIDADTRTYSDAGSVTGSFTGSLGGTSADGVFLTKGKKRGRKSKAEKEREREEGSLRAGMDRLGSVDVDGASVRGGASGGAGGGGGGEDADEDEDFDDEGELLGREEGTTDTEAEKKNMAYASLLLDDSISGLWAKLLTGSGVGCWWMHSIPSSRSDMTCSNEPNYERRRYDVLSIMRCRSLCRLVWLQRLMALRRCLRVRLLRRLVPCRRSGLSLMIRRLWLQLKLNRRRQQQRQPQHLGVLSRSPWKGGPCLRLWGRRMLSCLRIPIGASCCPRI